MPTVSEALYTHLSGYSPITAIVSTRIRPSQGIVQDPLPVLYYEISQDQPYEQSADVSPDRECVVMLKAYGTNHPQLETLMAAVRTRLKLKHALLGGTLHVTVFELESDNGAEFPMQGQNKAPYMLTYTASIQYTPAAS